MNEGRFMPAPKDATPAPPRGGAGRLSGLFAGVAMLGGALLLQAAGPATRYRDAPPPGVTGGFGEETCQSCHFQDEINLPPGTVSISGVPAHWAPGGVYAITVTLTRPTMELGGFQLTARFEDGGGQAGTIEIAPEDEERIRITTHGGVGYAHHLHGGTALTAPDTARWTVRWTAPADGGDVVFHTAGNAASDDDSPLGDYIYTAHRKSAAPVR